MSTLRALQVGVARTPQLPTGAGSTPAMPSFIVPSTIAQGLDGVVIVLLNLGARDGRMGLVDGAGLGEVEQMFSYWASEISVDQGRF